MRAIVQRSYGSTGMLQCRDIDPPALRRQEVLIRVHAAGVDRGVWHLVQGLPYLVRVAGYGLRRPKSPVPGMDVAGVVVKVGPAVTRFRPGDAVFGIGRGTFAELATASQDKLAARPANLDSTHAAPLAVSGLAALQAVRDHARVRRGDRVLVLGASGGVGSFAVQLAKAAGADVVGVCSASKADLVKHLGADQVIDYTSDQLANAGRFDVILDISGNRTLSTMRRLLTPRGRLVIVGGDGKGRWLGGTDRQLRALLLSPFVRHRLRPFVAKELRTDLLVLKELVEASALRPVVDQVFPLSEAPQALTYLVEGHARGKVVLAVNEPAA